MKIGIIGAGISGLSAAYELSKKGHSVTVFERSDTPGGLGTYVKIKGNFIERYYHHFFETDTHIVRLAEELKISSKLHFYKAKTGIYSGGAIYPFSTPLEILSFKPLSFFNRIRLGIVFGFVKFAPFVSRSLDSISAKDWILKYAGIDSYKKIWGPLLEGKFAKYASRVPAMWLWERVRDRSPRLGYFDGSVKILFDRLIEKIKKKKGQILLGTEVLGITSLNEQVVVNTKNKEHVFDRVIVTSVSPIAEKLLKDPLPRSYRTHLKSIDQLGAVCLIVELKKPIQSQYWISICDKNAPVLVMVEHTNMLSKKDYGGRSVVYLANYVHRSDLHFRLPDEEIIQSYLSFLKQVNKDFDMSWVVKTYLSRVPRAQTIFKLNSLKTIPRVRTPSKNIFLINIDQMYPHDRNLSQGAGLGKKVAGLVDKRVLQ